MRLTKVLIVFKKSTFQLQALEYQEPRFLRLLKEGHSSVSKVQAAHSEHYETLSVLQAELEKRGIQFEQVTRAELKDNVGNVDLVISVGGDGTFLDASHSVGNTPLLGVNSAKSSSFGHFCLARDNNVAEVLDGIQEGRIAPHRLLRLELILNEIPVPELVLNEVLVCHSSPAGTSRYFIQLGEEVEEHRSSGVWIGTPAGSTGSLKSAGGEILPITDSRFQYVVREPWTRPNQTFRFTRGLIPREGSIKVVSQMRTGAIFIDGQHIEYSFALGDELRVISADDDLIAFVDPHINNVFTAGRKGAERQSPDKGIGAAAAAAGGASGKPPSEPSGGESAGAGERFGRDG